MGGLQRLSSAVTVPAAIVAPLVVAAILAPFRGTFATTAAALTMVAVIAVVAVSGNRVAGVLASLSAAVWFDFFLTAPYFRLAIDHRAELETTVSIFVVGVFITELAGRSRHHWQAANEATEFVAMIHDVADLAARTASVPAIVDRASDSLVRILSLRSCRFDLKMADPPLARIEPSGDVVHVGLHWPAREIGIPGPEAEIVAQWKGRVVGRFVLTPTPGEAVSRVRRIVAVSLVDVVAASVVDQPHDS